MFPINHFIWLYVIILSRTRFRYNLPSKVAWMSKNFLLETETISEVIKYSFQVHSEDTRAMPEDLKVIYWPKVYLFFLKQSNWFFARLTTFQLPEKNIPTKSITTP